MGLHTGLAAGSGFTREGHGAPDRNHVGSVPGAGAAALTQPGPAVRAGWCCVTVARQ